jgi:predicted nucleic acid-binding protein
MVNLLLDTSVIIDALRQYPPAEIWLTQQTDPGVVSMVWIELLQGVKDKNA